MSGPSRLRSATGAARAATAGRPCETSSRRQIARLLSYTLRGRSSAGRAPALQAGGRRFDPVRLHQGFWRWTMRRQRHHVEKNKVCRRWALVRRLLVLYEIVKRRYVRIYSGCSRFVLQVQTARSSRLAAMLSAGPCGRERQVMSHGALIKPHADDWPLNRRAIGFISRSWSFLSNSSIAEWFVVLLVSPTGADCS